MSSDQPEVVATRTSTGHIESRSDDAPCVWTTKPEKLAHARAIVRLFQCQLCSLPLQEPVTLPCGRSICRQCLPETYARANITYPAVPSRSQGFKCPIADCKKEHAVKDCGYDVVLNKASQHVKDSINRGKEEAIKLQAKTCVAKQDEWAGAGVPSLRHNKGLSEVLDGGKLIATWNLAEKGNLKYETEVSYIDGTLEDFASFELEALRKIQEVARGEMDCQICYALFFDPLTTTCGHTFCRGCLHRILDHSNYCPVCRRKLAMSPLLNRDACPSNERLTRIMQTFWIDELKARQESIEAEKFRRHADFDVPLFICTLSFPMMPTLLHIFEPRYRLMIRRAIEGDGTFGMVLPKRVRHHGQAGFFEIGTLLRIVNAHFYPDGRSLIETMGISRFRVIDHGAVDGYAMGKIERIDDVSLEEEEALEAQETSAHTPQHASTSSDNSPPSAERKRRLSETETVVPAMSTQMLMDYALDFVERMRAQNVPWLTERVLTIYGECPRDPAVFPWWLGSMLPVRDQQKYRLLETWSVRARLKICCEWIMEWETNSW